MKEYLSIKEAAERLDVEYKTVWRLVNDGKLPAAKVRGVWRISLADLDAFFEQQKQLTAESTARRCAGCGRPIVSALSVGGRCQVCEAPLCLRCWRVEDRRRCARHQPFEEVVMTEQEKLARCARCRQVISSVEMAGGRCEAPGCEALLCVNCWRQPDAHLCRQHAPAAEEKLQAARARLERGEIDRLVTSVEAKAREISFISRFNQKVRQVATLRDPITKQVLRITDWDRCHVTGDDSDQLLEILGGGYLDKALLSRVPVNLRSRYQVPTPDAPSLIIEAVVLSHLEAHARDGFDTAPLTRSDLLPRLEEQAARAERLGLAHVLGIAATSGWDEEATNYLGADPTGTSYSHGRLLPYLIDLHTGQITYNRLDKRMAALADLFSPKLLGEEVQTVVDYVLQIMFTSGMNSLTAAQVTQALAVRPEVVREAFQQLSSDGEFIMEDISGLGLVIARR